MRRALKEIGTRLGAVETETFILQATLHEIVAVAQRLRGQRDEALDDRDAAVKVIFEACAELGRGPDGTNDPTPVLEYFFESLRSVGYADLAASLGPLSIEDVYRPPT